MIQYDFYKTQGVPGGPKNFSVVVEGPEFLSCVYVFFYDFYKTPGGPKHFSEVVEASECLASL